MEQKTIIIIGVVIIFIIILTIISSISSILKSKNSTQDLQFKIQKIGPTTLTVSGPCNKLKCPDGYTLTQGGKIDDNNCSNFCESDESFKTPPPKPRETVPPTIHNIQFNELRNLSSELCLDSFGREGVLKVNKCHRLKGNQQWGFYESGEIKNPSTGLCLDSYGRSGTAMISKCHGLRGNQDWRINNDTGEIKNPSSGLCLDSYGREGDAMVSNCHGLKGNQAWTSMR